MLEKYNLEYISPLPPKKGGFHYREQHKIALEKYFYVYAQDPPIFGVVSFLLYIILSPLMLLISVYCVLTDKLEFDVTYVEYDFAAYKLFFFVNAVLDKLFFPHLFVFRLHEDYTNLKYGWLLRFWDNFWLAISADIIIVHNYEQAERLWKINQRKGTVIVSGLDIEKQPKRKSEKNIIILPGFINKWKGHDIILEAMPRILETIPDAKLIIAGKIHDRKYFEELQSIIDYFSIPKKNIELHTDYLNKPTMDELLSRASLAILPYRRITFSAALLDCINLGLPVITSDIPELVELCKTKKNGIPHFNMNDGWQFPQYGLAQNIIHLLKNKKAYALAKASMAELRKKYDIDRIVSEEADIIYKEMGVARDGR